MLSPALPVADGTGAGLGVGSGVGVGLGVGSGVGIGFGVGVESSTSGGLGVYEGSGVSIGVGVGYSQAGVNELSLPIAIEYPMYKKTATVSSTSRVSRLSHFGGSDFSNFGALLGNNFRKRKTTHKMPTITIMDATMTKGNENTACSPI